MRAFEITATVLAEGLSELSGIGAIEQLWA